MYAHHCRTLVQEKRFIVLLYRLVTMVGPAVNRHFSSCVCGNQNRWTLPHLYSKCFLVPKPNNSISQVSLQHNEMQITKKTLISDVYSEDSVLTPCVHVNVWLHQAWPINFGESSVQYFIYSAEPVISYWQLRPSTALLHFLHILLPSLTSLTHTHTHTHVRTKAHNPGVSYSQPFTVTCSNSKRCEKW